MTSRGVGTARALLAATVTGSVVALLGGPVGASTTSGFPVVARSSLVATATATLRAEFKAQHLHLVQLGCVKNGRSFKGHPIVRCSADFGDPHVQAYCTVVIGNRLLTNYDNGAIPCGPDWSGWQVIRFSSSPHG